MRKTIALIFIIMLSPTLIGCNLVEEIKAKSLTRAYYNAMKDEDYDMAFKHLYLYDYTEDQHPTNGTTLSEQEAKKFYMLKIDYLKDREYIVKDFQIENIRYEDGHTFFLQVSLNVEQDGERFERSETVDVWEGKVWIIKTDDPYSSYRDGKMNVDIE